MCDSQLRPIHGFDSIVESRDGNFYTGIHFLPHSQQSRCVDSSISGLKSKKKIVSGLIWKKSSILVLIYPTIQALGIWDSSHFTYTRNT